MEAANDLPLYQAFNTAAFLIFLVALFLVVRSVSRLGRQKEGKSMKPSLKRFVELEEDYRWRRIKIAYFTATLTMQIALILVVYGSDGRAPLQSQVAYELERASDRFNTIFSLFIATLIAWVIYRFMLPRLYAYVIRLGIYLKRAD